MSGDTEKRAGFDKWLRGIGERLAKMSTPEDSLNLPKAKRLFVAILNEELLPLLAAAEGVTTYPKAGEAIAIGILRSELDKIRSKS